MADRIQDSSVFPGPVSENIDAFVVGNGIFGRVIQQALARAGLKTALAGVTRVGAGSLPAACLIKPSWVSSMPRQEFDSSLELLNDLYGVREIPFRVGPMMKATVFHVPPSLILGHNRLPQLDALVSLEPPFVSCRAQGGELLVRAKHVILATGIWAAELAPQLAGQVKPRGGWACRNQGRLREAFIEPYAPYRQLVGFNMPSEDNAVWIGDGTALKPESMDEARGKKTLERCVAAALRHGDVPKSGWRAILGLRPYVDKLKLPCLLQKVEIEGMSSVWVATGGAKNGTIGAAWAARRLTETLQ